MTIAKSGATAALFIHMFVFMGSMIGELKIICSSQEMTNFKK